MLTPVKDIIVLDTSGKILNYTCEVVSDEPLNCTTATLRKHLINEITRMIYSGMNEFYDCVK